MNRESYEAIDHPKPDKRCRINYSDSVIASKQVRRGYGADIYDTHQRAEPAAIVFKQLVRSSPNQQYDTAQQETKKQSPESACA